METERTIVEMDWKELFIQLTAKGNLDHALAIKAAHFPDRLFKYVSINALDKKLYAFMHDKVWMSDPARMNDPYDSALTFDGIQLGNWLFKNNFDDFAARTQLNKHFNDVEIAVINSYDNPIEGMKHALRLKYPGRDIMIEEITKFVEARFLNNRIELQQRLSDTLRSSLKMSCFSEVNNSILMWSHYASQHEGFCIEYNIKSLPSSDPRFRLTFPVKYTDNLIDVTKMLIENDTESLLPTIAAVHKSTEWSYEKEWRLIIPAGIMDKDGYYEVPMPTRIYIGSRMTEDNRQKILEIARAKKIPVFVMQPKMGSFLLEAIRI